MASLARAGVPNPWGCLWLCLVYLGACKLGAAAPASTWSQPASAPAAPIRDAAPAPAPDAPAIAECRTPFGKLLAELGQAQLVDMALVRDSLMVLLKEDEGREARVLRVRTDRALAEPKVVGGCPHGAHRIAVDANYLYLPCLGSLPADATPNWIDAPRNPDGNVWAVPLDGGKPHLLAPHARRPFWIGVDSSFVTWFDRVILYRLSRPEPGIAVGESSPERMAQHGADRPVFLGSDGTYFQYFHDIMRATPGHMDRWRLPDLMNLLGVNARNEIFVELDRQHNDVFRFVPESGARVPVARIDQPVMGILWLRDGSMLVRSIDAIWHTAFAGDSPTSTTRWRHFPRTIVGWAADEHTLYLALKGSSLNRNRGFGLYALPLQCGATPEP